MTTMYQTTYADDAFYPTSPNRAQYLSGGFVRPQDRPHPQPQSTYNNQSSPYDQGRGYDNQHPAPLDSTQLSSHANPSNVTFEPSSLGESDGAASLTRTSSERSRGYNGQAAYQPSPAIMHPRVTSQSRSASTPMPVPNVPQNPNMAYPAPFNVSPTNGTPAYHNGQGDPDRIPPYRHPPYQDNRGEQGDPRSTPIVAEYFSDAPAAMDTGPNQECMPFQGKYHQGGGTVGMTINDDARNPQRQQSMATTHYTITNMSDYSSNPKTAATSIFPASPPTNSPPRGPQPFGQLYGEEQRYQEYRKDSDIPPTPVRDAIRDVAIPYPPVNVPPAPNWSYNNPQAQPAGYHGKREPSVTGRSDSLHEGKSSADDAVAPEGNVLKVTATFEGQIPKAAPKQYRKKEPRHLDPHAPKGEINSHHSGAKLNNGGAVNQAVNPQPTPKSCNRHGIRHWLSKTLGRHNCRSSK